MRVGRPQEDRSEGSRLGGTRPDTCETARSVALDGHRLTGDLADVSVASLSPVDRPPLVVHTWSRYGPVHGRCGVIRRSRSPVRSAGRCGLPVYRYPARYRVPGSCAFPACDSGRETSSRARLPPGPFGTPGGKTVLGRSATPTGASPARSDRQAFAVVTLQAGGRDRFGGTRSERFGRSHSFHRGPGRQTTVVNAHGPAVLYPYVRTRAAVMPGTDSTHRPNTPNTV